MAKAQAQKTDNTASRASLWMAQCSPLRTRLVADLIRGQSLEEANRRLLLEKVKPAKIILKILRSAMANASQKGLADLDRLYVSEILVDEGPRIKRFMPRAQGRADQRLTRTSHISLKLGEKVAMGPGALKKAKATAKAQQQKSQKGGEK